MKLEQLLTGNSENTATDLRVQQVVFMTHKFLAPFHYIDTSMDETISTLQIATRLVLQCTDTHLKVSLVTAIQSNSLKLMEIRHCTVHTMVSTFTHLT